MQELSIYDNARKAVSLLTDIDELKDSLDKAQAVVEYMRRAGDIDMAAKAARYSVYCQRQAGILLKDMDKNKGAAQATRSSDTTTLKDIGISKDQSSQYQKLASIEDKKFDKVVDTQINNGFIPNRSSTLRLAGGDDNIVTKFTGNNEWYTPEIYIESARKVMGSIDLDPASNETAQSIVKAKTYYTIDDDGLSYDWTGNIWMNPPYSAKEIKQFIDKLLSSDFDQAIVLTNNSTDTSWFKSLATHCDLICFTDGRIKFYSKDGKSSAPTNGQAFYYFGENTDAFNSEFKARGLIMEVVK